jgi:adenosylcobinamide kinase/adenosylcobinamide-phosphate guanylyltransferase
MPHKVKVILISGGQRSGKSRYAEEMALSLSDNPIYRIFDDEMQHRVDVHRSRRGTAWRSVEAPDNLDITLNDGDTALLDCLTMLATNRYFDLDEDIDRAYDAVVEQLERLTEADADATLIVVTNEIGLGGVAANAMQRRFADLQGSLNQWVGRRADSAYLVVAGLPLRLK